ncbi:MAG: glycosyltransferase [Thermomicrobiales bacterium]
MGIASYAGPTVFGYETDALRRVAAISVHTSPLATLGGKDAGGMNVYIRELSCQTAQLGLPVDIFTRRTNPESPETVAICDGVNLVSITAGPIAPLDKNELFQYLPEFAEQTALYSLREGVRYDVVHAHYWLSGWVAHLLKRFWDAPFVQMFHTTAHMKNAVSPIGERETPLRARTERRLVELADSIIAANPDERADLAGRQRTPFDKICTIPPGVDLDLFRLGDRARSRADLGLDPDRPIVLYVGRIDPIKGIDTLLRTIGRVGADASVEPLFMIVGGDLNALGQPTGPLRKFAESAAVAGIDHLCSFVGSQPQDRLPLFYTASDLVLVPSRYESFGLVAVEAMACGIPVVASRAGGLRFTVQEGITGLLADVGDDRGFAGACTRLLSDGELRSSMGSNAHAAAQRFSWPAVASSIQHVYKNLAEGSRANLCCAEEIYA